MNVLIINPMIYTAPLKGAPIPRTETIEDTLIVNLCRGFVQNGHQVTLIASAEYRPTKDEKFEFDIIYLENTITRYIAKFPHGLPVLKGLRKFLKQNHTRYDTVISSELFTFHSITAARICPNKLIISQEFGYHHKFFHQIPSRIWHNTIVRLFIKKRVVVIPRSSIARTFVRQYCNLVSEMVNITVNTNTFRYNKDKEDYLIVVSRLIPTKNIRYILEQFIRYIKKYNKQIRLCVIGDGPERGALEQYVQAEAASDQVEFYGRLSHGEFAPILARAKGLLCCTLKDLNQVSISEALACGTPVLTNRVPLQHEMITENGIGIVEDYWTEDDIHRLVENSPEYVRNCERICPTFSNTEAAASMLRIFKNFHSFA